VVTSGYRCESHNVAVGSSVTSRHLIGCAADLALPVGMSYKTFAALCRRFARLNFEVVTYAAETHVHNAVARGYSTNIWTGGIITL
jgi:uncharacterized protein YcbK (DUF882 family)